jgi:SNF2 family DNA or RNA helicase
VHHLADLHAKEGQGTPDARGCRRHRKHRELRQYVIPYYQLSLSSSNAGADLIVYVLRAFPDARSDRVLARVRPLFTAFICDPCLPYLVFLFLRTDPDDKIIIFSQWTSFIDLIGVVLKRAGHRFLEYTGDMSRTVRAANVRNFMKNDKTKILVISLKSVFPLAKATERLERVGSVELAADLVWLPVFCDTGAEELDST